MALAALALNCTLKASGAASSTDKLLREVLAELGRHEISGEVVRVVDLDIRPGVTSDEGPGDDWPALRKKILAADILVFGTPVWLGQPSSVARRVLERMDAFLGETDDKKRTPSFGKVAVVAVVGNEDGAHHVGAELFQGLDDVGFSLAAGAMTYWVGEAMGSVDFKDLDAPPEKVVQTTAAMVANAVHLARLLEADPYPSIA